ncbi:RNA polymerase sigma factor [Algoriphagus machipongonensis]|uniref:RNA polymerase ECF-type sigma factor n=1 Tax=Algoriphagus machipongonensis TaxID=388413 RepID=A3HW07_9BACT|nr:RNA polymerase sigma factor [Algoriphagus machipongonensis]EAZ82329.2 RNA polymerase ECF-type sigma factor [Algoriphagus machipongonensis]
MNRKQLDHIIHSYHREAYIWARQCAMFDDELAKDVLQQVYLKILEGRAKLKDPSKAKTWLFSIIRYTAIDALRVSGKLLSLEDSYDFEDVQEEIDHTDYQAMIKQLPKMQQEVLLMVFYHQMTIEQSAEVLQIGLGTARTHYSRGKMKLKDLITKTQMQE